ncbi:enolase C-terminal domain-like protein [Nesterenkonia sp. PF2B19]|uniref:enolase C-terminal domain-like protein n=1 Tax=Nesterenkonia sp. PF2B19 TaxID=1881858 RepID=UPI00111C840A|nr:enolase C-terminal domain-like protein [Nesterenkonia sp. PF2B19]
MPLKRPFGTSRATTQSSINFLVRLHSTHHGRSLVGVGEAQPRNRLTGDVSRRAAWRFFSEAVESLHEVELDVTNPDVARREVIRVMDDLQALAVRRSVDANREKPHRGTLLGLEIALLDLVAQALDVSLTEVLGSVRRDDVVVTASTIPTQASQSVLTRKVNRQSTRFSVNRVKGIGDADADYSSLLVIHEANVATETPKQIWMDLNEGLDVEGAREFLQRLVRGMGAGELPESIVLEQPVPKASGEHMPVLQQYADSLTAEAGVGDICLMVDESVWDADDVEDLFGLGGCRALNIKLAKAGGLLPALAAAERAVALDPDVKIYIGGMIGTSDLSIWAMRQLIRALPRIDFMSTTPPSNLEERIANPLVKLRKGTGVFEPSEISGLGSALAYEKLAPYIVEQDWYPAPRVSSLLDGENSYQVEHLQGFREIQLDNHVLEREALALGLDTVRTSTIEFVAESSNGAQLAFSWTKSNATSSLAATVTTDKQTTRELLLGAGVPVPVGRRFDIEDVEPAVEYAESLGYPVVFKPLRGTGGKGVIPGIADADELRWAFERLKGSSLAAPGVVVEEHFDGREFRILCRSDGALSAVERRPGMVEGDGMLSIAELMMIKHANRMKNPHLRSRKIKFDDTARLQLSRQGMDFDTVPEVGQRVVYTLSPSFHQGGESSEMLADMHPTILDAATRAVGAVPGLAYGGVDFIVADPGASVEEQKCGVLEVNSSPSQGSHEFPMHGKKTRVSREMVRHVADSVGVKLQEAPLDELDLRVILTGDFSANSDPVGWLATAAESRRLAGWVRQWGGDVLECEVSGPTDAAASLVSAASRSVRGIRVHSVEASHHDVRHTGAFEVRQ